MEGQDNHVRGGGGRGRGMRAVNFFSESTIIHSQLGICKLREVVDPETRKDKRA